MASADLLKRRKALSMKSVDLLRVINSVAKGASSQGITFPSIVNATLVRVGPFAPYFAFSAAFAVNIQTTEKTLTNIYRFIGPRRLISTEVDTCGICSRN